MKVKIERAYTISPLARKYLQESIDRPPGSVETLESIEEAVKTEAGYLIEFSDKELLGVLLLSFEKPHININLFGGKDIMKWRDHLIDFIQSLCNDSGLTAVFASRKGWEKIFPELKVIGALYALAPSPALNLPDSIH